MISLHQALFSMLKYESIPPKIRNKTRVSSLPFLFNIILEVLATAIREDKEIKRIQTGKEEVPLSLFGDDMKLYIENLKIVSEKH